MVASSSSSTLSAQAGSGKKVALVVSRYHEDLTQLLWQGAVDTLKKYGVKDSDIKTVWVPGAFEIPLVARTLTHQDVDAVICLGIIVKGETTHDAYIAAEVARGVSAAALASETPVLFGVLTTQNLEQAKARCGGNRGHKGVEAAEAAVTMIQVMDELDSLKTKEVRNVGFGGR